MKEAANLYGTLKQCCCRSTCCHPLFTPGFTISCLLFSCSTTSTSFLPPFFPHPQPCGVKAVASFYLLPDLKLQLLPPVPGPPLRLGMGWAAAVQSCSTVPVLDFPAPRALSHSTELLLQPAGPGRTWAPWWAKAAAALGPDSPWKCCTQQLHFKKCLWLR